MDRAVGLGTMRLGATRGIDLGLLKGKGEVLIDFSIRFQEMAGIVARVEVHFMQSTIEVVMRSIATLSDAEWDSKRMAISNSSHENWTSVYQSTAIEKDLDEMVLSAESMMAFGALHVLVPDSVTARQLALQPGMVSAKYPRGVVCDGLGNKLRLLHSPLSEPEAIAAVELLKVGILQELEVHAYGATGTKVKQKYYFAPFHAPMLASVSLSQDAHCLKSKLP